MPSARSSRRRWPPESDAARAPARSASPTSSSTSLDRPRGGVGGAVELDRLAHVEVGIQALLLQHDADAPAERALPQRGVVAEHADLAGVRARDGPRGSRAGWSCRRRWGRAARAARRGGRSGRRRRAPGAARRPCARRWRGSPAPGRSPVRAAAAASREFVIMPDSIGPRRPRDIGAGAEPASPPAGGGRSTRAAMTGRARALTVCVVTQPNPPVALRVFAVVSIVAVLLSVIFSEPRPALSGDGLAITVALLAFAGGLWVSRPWGTTTDRTRMAGISMLGAASVALTALQPDGAGYAGVYFVVVVAAARLPRRQGRIQLSWTASYSAPRTLRKSPSVPTPTARASDPNLAAVLSPDKPATRISRFPPYISP